MNAPIRIEAPAPDIRDVALDAQLEAIRNRGTALRAAWALQAAANEAERLGCAPPMLAYWRGLASEIEGMMR